MADFQPDGQAVDTIVRVERALADDDRAMEAARVERAGEISTRFLDNIETVVYGKREEIKLVLTALVCDGHVLLEDVPGTAKTMLARAIAGSIEGATTSRIQCTPDLQPTDVTGLSIFDQRSRDFEFRPGPIFTNVVLVDEINRATPKTQSALLEAMEEGAVTVDGVTRSTGAPFLVIATQNPIEQAGTYPLPEAQLDRFMIKTSLGYPDLAATVRILEATSEVTHELNPVITPQALVGMAGIARAVHADPVIFDYIGRVIEAADPWCRGVVLLGLEAPEAELEAAFGATKGAPIVKGFAIGRTIFNDAAEKWLSGAINDKAAVDDMAGRFARLTEAWKRSRA